jgi:hypothetical protein
MDSTESPPIAPQNNQSPVYVGLLHTPMLDRQGRVVTTAVTNMDIHDIARSCRTYGVAKYFIVHPEPAQEVILRRILRHWEPGGVSAKYHPKRVQALSQVEHVKTFDDMLSAIAAENGGRKPLVAMPDARPWPKSMDYAELRRCRLAGELGPVLLVFGTGWGLAPEFFSRIDVVLDPIRGPGAYNHLSVRAACAIVLDRILRME